MNFKTKLPCLESCVQSVFKNLFKIGFTWHGGGTNVYLDLTDCILYLDMENKTISWDGSSSLHDIDFFKDPRTYIEWHRLLYPIENIREHEEDLKIYENLVWYRTEGWKTDP